MNQSLPEKFKIVDASAGPVTTNGGVTGDYVSLKNVIRAWIIASFTQAVGHATGIDPMQASAVAGTGVKALTNDCRVWANEDTAASDTLVEKTAAKTYDVTNDVKKKIVVFEIDPVSLDSANDFECLGVAVDNSGQATNFVSILYVLEYKYQGKSDNLPAAITD